MERILIWSGMGLVLWPDVGHCARARPYRGRNAQAYGPEDNATMGAEGSL